jgi:uncharacterized damage-inducible protein DinB
MATRYAANNTAEREHLAAVIKRLTDEELSRPVGGSGWTAAGLLAHLAFWDRRALLLLRKWQAHGVGPSAMDLDIVNDTAREFLVALPVRTAARLALEAAEAIDSEIESLSAELQAEVETKGKTVWLDRGAHRRNHLSKIEQALAAR